MSNQERIEAIIDQACKDNHDGNRWSAETVGYLAMWVLQLQDDLEAERSKIEGLEIDKQMLIDERNLLKQEWWKMVDKDIAYQKVLTGE